MAIALPAAEAAPFTEAATWLADLKLVVTVWLGGVVFFGTLFS